MNRTLRTILFVLVSLSGCVTQEGRVWQDGKLIVEVIQRCDARACSASVPIPGTPLVPQPESWKVGTREAAVAAPPFPKTDDEYFKALYDSQRAYIEQQKVRLDAAGISPGVRDALLYGLAVLCTIAIAF